MTELSPDDWVYEGLMSYVFTHRDMEDTENIKFVSDSPVFDSSVEWKKEKIYGFAEAHQLYHN